MDQPLQVNPTGQHGREQRQHVLLHFADGRGQGADDGIESHLLDDVLEGCGRLACDSTQGLQEDKHRSVTDSAGTGHPHPTDAT